jgi:uncharacterized RDD family membrane protein YckC
MYCSKCGAAMANAAAFCSTCGQAFPVYAAVQRVEYAGFWLRFLAYVIDSAVMTLGIAVVLIPLLLLTGLGALLRRIRPEEDWGDAGFILILGLLFLAATVSLVVTWLYHALMECSEWQATVGKRVMGLVVADLAGQRISFARATGRHFGKIVTNMVPLAIGYIMAGFTERRQALHDMLAGCLVLRRS